MRDDISEVEQKLFGISYATMNGERKPAGVEYQYA